MKTKDERTGRDNNNYYCRTRFNLRTCISLRTLTPFEATRFSSLRTLTTQSFLRRTRLHAITINIPIKFVGGSGVILICIGSPVRRIYLYAYTCTSYTETYRTRVPLKRYSSRPCYVGNRTKLKNKWLEMEKMSAEFP